MANYLYRTILYKNPSTVIDVDSNNDTNLADFVNNRKASAVKISEIQIAETTFVTDDTYTAFSARVAAPLTWADVKYKEDGNYILYLLQ